MKKKLDIFQSIIAWMASIKNFCKAIRSKNNVRNKVFHKFLVGLACLENLERFTIRSDLRNYLKKFKVSSQD